MFACVTETALYGLMLIQPLMTWLVASLDQHGVAFVGISLPSLAPGDPTMAGEVNLVRELGAGLVLLLLAFHIRNRGLAMVAAAARSLANQGSRLRATRDLRRPARSNRLRSQRGQVHESHQGSKAPGA